MMLHRNNKNKDASGTKPSRGSRDNKPLFQMKTSYDKVAKAMTEPPKDYDTIKILIEDKKENILDLNINKNSKILI